VYISKHTVGVEFDGPAELVLGSCMLLGGLLAGTVNAVYKFRSLRSFLIAFSVIAVSLVISCLVVGYVISESFIGRYGYHERCPNYDCSPIGVRGQ
jgi:hypothetical protein